MSLSVNQRNASEILVIFTDIAHKTLLRLRRTFISDVSLEKGCVVLPTCFMNQRSSQSANASWAIVTYESSRRMNLISFNMFLSWICELYFEVRHDSGDSDPEAGSRPFGCVESVTDRTSFLHPVLCAETSAPTGWYVMLQWPGMHGSEFSRWQRSNTDAKWFFLTLFLASSITSFLFLTFVSCHARIFIQFSPFFIHCYLCIWIFLLLEASEWVCAQDCNEL